MKNILEIYQEKLIDLSQAILDDFFTSLLDAKVSSHTAQRHTENAEIFLVNFTNFQYMQHAGEITQEKVKDFTNLWYFQKIEEPSRSDYIKIVASLKKLIDFLVERDIMKPEEGKSIKKFLSDRSHFSSCYDAFEANPAKYPIHNQDYLASLDHFSEELDEIESLEDEMDDLDDDLNDDLNDDLEESDEEDGWDKSDEDLDDMKDYEECSLDELLSEVEDICNLSGAELRQVKNNVIELMPDKSRIFYPSQPASLPLSPKTGEEEYDAISRNCLLFLRANRVFERWLDRNFVHPVTIPPVNASICICSTAIVERLYEMIGEKCIGKDDFSRIESALNRLDQSMWPNREAIAQNAGLNLAEFII